MVEWGWTKKIAHHESYGKTDKKMNTTSANMTYLVDNKKYLCQHKKLHPLTARRGKLISEKMYKYIENIINQDSQKFVTSEGRDDSSNQKLTNCEIEYDQFCCSDCTKSLCLEIKNKMSVLKKLYDLVKALNLNDDNEEKCHGVTTDFIRKLTDLFFITIGEKESTKILSRKMDWLRKSETLTRVYRPM